MWPSNAGGLKTKGSKEHTIALWDQIRSYNQGGLIRVAK